MKLKKNDKVIVLSGRDKGKTGEVREVFPQISRVLVEGVGVVKRHTKPSSKNPQGGILEIEKPLDASKVALVCPNCKQPSRIGYQINGDVKERICRKCKSVVK